jgi:hypothetical protein
MSLFFELFIQYQFLSDFKEAITYVTSILPLNLDSPRYLIDSLLDNTFVHWY